MSDYFKNLNFEEIKPFTIAAVCFTAIFLAGFGAGKLHSGTTGSPAKRTLSNYTTNSEGMENKKSDDSSAKSSSSVSKTPTNSTTNASTTGECYIKGSKSKIYHMPGGSFYERTNAAQSFASEEEAQAAGFTKSSR